MGNSALNWLLLRRSFEFSTLLFVVLLLILLPFKIDREHKSFVSFVKNEQLTPSYIELLGKSLSLHDIIDFNKSSLALFQLDPSRLMLPQGGVLSAEEEQVLRYFDYLYSSKTSKKTNVEDIFLYVGLYRSDAMYFASPIPEDVKARLIKDRTSTNEFCQSLHYCAKDATPESLADGIVLSIPYQDEVSGKVILSMASPISSSNDPNHFIGDVIADTALMTSVFMRNKHVELQKTDYGTELVITTDSLWAELTPEFLFYSMTNHLDNMTSLTYKISIFRFIVWNLPLWFLLSIVIFFVQININRFRKLHTERQRFSEAMLLDAFTRTYNKKVYETTLFDVATKGHYAVICVDGDKIKTINDTYGHKLGDMAIMQIVDAMRSVFRENDLLIRTGGDEFVVILANCTFERALLLAEHLRQAVAERQFLNVLTVSCGVADSQDYASFEAVLQAADKALYEDKKNKQGSRKLDPTP